MAGERILVVEDESAVARGLEYALRHEGFEVLWAANGESALELAHRQDPHLILLDIRLPGISGFDVCRQLRAEGRRQPILMLTARDEEMDKVLGLEMGADDYVVKPFSLRELISRIRALLRRAYGPLADPAGGGLLRAGQLVELTPTEFRLLRHLVIHPGQPFSREELIDAVWGYDSSVGSGRTVDVHMRHLREKLEQDPADPRFLVTVRGLGYMFEP
jgi:two-component system response regulator VicR